MSAEKNVPEIRFKGFSGEWNYFSLEEISDVLDGDRGHNYPNGEDLKEQGHTLFLNASNVTKNGFKFDTRQYITKEKSDSLGNGKLFLGDIVLTSRGSIGHIAWYNEDVTKKIPFARINSGMLILRVKDHIAPSVISQYLKSPKGKKKIEGISFGSAQPQLTKASVSKFSISIPIEKTEQTAIGNTFQKLDSLINQHQQKHDKLSSLKKAMLEKMFPKQGETVPEIRFKRFSGEWEEKELGSVTQITMGQSPSGENYTSNPNDFILVQGNADLKNGFVVPRVWTSEVTKTAAKGALIFSVRAPVGEVGKTNFDVVLGRGVAAIYGNEFMYQQLQKLKSDNYWQKVSAGSTFDAISSTELASTLI
jgi:type I restriction enzyme S subunit